MCLQVDGHSTDGFHWCQAQARMLDWEGTTPPAHNYFVDSLTIYNALCTVPGGREESVHKTPRAAAACSRSMDPRLQR
jgi:hypothetical protein